MPDTTVDLLQRIIATAQLIDQSREYSTSPINNSTIPDDFIIPPFPPLQDITSKLLKLGLSPATAEQMSLAFIRKAEQLKESSKATIRATWTKLVSLPRPCASLPLTKLQDQLFNAHHHIYSQTLDQWAQEVEDLACLHVTKLNMNLPSRSSEKRTLKSKRQFKSEYLPLFEFAFEKDRFPSREDKMHLARISSMSYRQVSVWFQNRRCRQASRVKSNRITSAPKTFEEMKERLSLSAREALSRPLPFMKKLNPSAADYATTGEPVLAQDNPQLPSLPEIIVLDDAPSPKPDTRAIFLETDGATSPASSRRATSLEATEDGYEADDCDESAGDDFLGIPIYQLPVFEEPTPFRETCNPLNPLKTSVHAFPAVYEPSQLTSDPFLIEHHPWMRDPRTNSKKFVDAMPEAMEDIMGGFDRMDVDEPDAKTADNRHSRVSMQRHVSSGSFGLWSSGESTAASHTSTYSSSVQSSPRIPEANLPGPLEADDSSAKYTFETNYVSDADLGTEAETVCDQPEESPAAGPSTASLKAQVTWDSSAEERGDAWTLESITLHANPPNPTLKWQNLLAVAAQASE